MADTLEQHESLVLRFPELEWTPIPHRHEMRVENRDTGKGVTIPMDCDRSFLFGLCVGLCGRIS